MDRDNDCESIFIEDVTEKKKTGRSAFSKTNCTRKRNGGMPSDFLKGKKLREYMGNSEVKVYNLNDVANVKAYNGRKKTTYEDDICIIKMYQNGEKISAITSNYGISPPVVYNILKANGIQKKSEVEKEVKQISEAYQDLVDESMSEENKIDRIKMDIVHMFIKNEFSYIEAVQALKAAKGELQQRKLV